MTNFDAPPPLIQRSLADVVSDNAQAASVLERFGLDYGCHGDQTLEEAARERRVPVLEVVGCAGGARHVGARRRSSKRLGRSRRARRLHRHASSPLRAPDNSSHHRVAREARRTPRRTTAATARSPETFLELARELLVHMTKEENVLFPFISDLAVAARTGERLPRSPFGTILHPVRVMKRDHRLAGDLGARLRTLTKGCQPPKDACRTFQLCFAELFRFETDLHRHVHLEDHVLFPRTLALEADLT